MASGQLRGRVAEPAFPAAIALLQNKVKGREKTGAGVAPQKTRRHENSEAWLSMWSRKRERQAPSRVRKLMQPSLMHRYLETVS
jgi:hypothetical protein